jgi:hypothetical protein
LIVLFRGVAEAFRLPPTRFCRNWSSLAFCSASRFFTVEVDKTYSGLDFFGFWSWRDRDLVIQVGGTLDYEKLL